MRIGFGQFAQTTPEFLQFAAQYGATDVLVNLIFERGLGERLELVHLVRLRREVEEWGLKLSAIENVPASFYDQIMLGGPNRERQIENMIVTVRNMARAGIPLFGYNWMPSGVWRTKPAVLRGGAIGAAYDHSAGGHFPPTHGQVFDEEEMWANLEDWIRIITPVAEEEGIRLGIHPSDPPVPYLGGVPQLLRSSVAFDRLLSVYPSPSNGIVFCQGTFAQMADEAIYELIERYASSGEILYVHFRNVSGTVPQFHEEFINTGYVDMARAMRLYKDAGYDSFFIDDHVPATTGDTAWGHRGRAFASGYLQGLIDSLDRDGVERSLGAGSRVGHARDG